jgi:hypothetical protein
MSQSVAVAGVVEGGKRGELFGDALTEEGLPSRKPVTVYVMLTKGSLDEKKWALL